VLHHPSMPLDRLPSGRWRARVWHAGRYHTVTRRTKAEARHAAAALAVELHGRPRDRTDVTLGELLIGHLADARDRWAPTYHEDATRVVDRLPDDVLDIPLVDITAGSLTALYRRLVVDGWSAHRVHRLHRVMSTAWGDAITFRWASSNPCRDARQPRVAQSDVAPPSHDQVQAVVAAARPYFVLCVQLAVATGARRGELVALRWSDVDLEGASVTIRRSLTVTPKAGRVVRPTKTGTSGQRVLALDASTAQALTVWRDTQQAAATAAALPEPVHLFSSDGGVTPWRPDYVSREFHRTCLRADVTGVRFHDLRHYVITTMLEDGWSVHDAAGQAGHSSTAVTESVYRHFLPGRGREAAERRAARLTFSSPKVGRSDG
jgi:integrase